MFYVGKGCDNRVFAHEQFALGAKRDTELISSEETPQLKVETIQQISSSGRIVGKFIANYGLSESEAFASENTLINYFNTIEGYNLTNIVRGHGERGMWADKLEKIYGYTPMGKADILSDNLILAVKIDDSFHLSDDEDVDYTFNNEDPDNLKCRTLGNWCTDKRKNEDIRYVIGVNKSAKNSVVSAYKVTRYDTKPQKSKTGLRDMSRTRFFTDSRSRDTLDELGLYKRCLQDLKFGSGQSIAYIKASD
ncbi:MAG: hypothetical protein FWD65_03040 [Coriobacteriia bacterium]|nr:hypothetical protein [Coriobacteriia bacterium]